MKDPKLVRSVSILQMLTSALGIVFATMILTRSSEGIEIGAISIALMLVPIPYLLAGFWLWNGKRKGLIISVILTALAVVDIHTENTTFFFATGYQLNLSWAEFSIDLWSLLILSGLIAIILRKSLVEPVSPYNSGQSLRD